MSNTLDLFPFVGKYYDGESAYGHPAHFTVSNAGIHVTIDGLAMHFDLPWKQLNREETHQESTLLRLSFFEYPEKVLEIEDATSLKAVQHTMTQQGLLVASWKVVKSKSLVAWALIGIILLVSIWFTISPLTDVISEHIPFEVEQKIGNQLKPALLNMHAAAQPSAEWQTAHETYLRYFDTHIQAYEIILVNSKVVNAFALPGGTLVMFTGMLDKLSSAEEYFALLAHEVGHVERRHVTKNLVRASFLSALFSLSIGDVAGISIVLNEAAKNLTNLSFSRKTEADADNYALEQFRRNGFDASGAATMFDKLATLESGSQIEYLSSHPLSTKRADDARAFAKAYPASKPFPKELEQAWVYIKTRNK